MTSMTCPAIASPLNFSTMHESPLLAESTKGLSIWYGSPVSTTLLFSPARVRIVLTSWGERFWASSMMMYWFGIDRPRM